MKFKKTVSLVCAAVLSLGTVFAVSASAYSMGDVNRDNKITAADARLALRASVELEKLDDEAKKLADVNFDDKITAADARLILRASVGLETLKEPGYTLNGHKVSASSITPEKGLSCTDDDCTWEMPSFNELVNALKTPGSTNSFYGFTKEELVTPQPECKANSVLYTGLAEIIGGFLKDSVEDGNSTEYTDFTSHRHINNATFFVTGTNYISDLKDSDIKSITTEKMTGVDFVKALPDKCTFSDTGAEYNFSKIKASKIGDVYKVTVTLNPETATKENVPTDVTPIEKILNKNYNSGIKQNIESIDTSFGDGEMQDMITMDMSITTSCTVSYYFTVDGFEPVAAKYEVKMQTVSKMYTYFNNLIQKTDKATTTTTIENNLNTENYFFFNDFFTFE